MIYWFDGQWFDQDTLTLPVQDPGLLYGATVFTTLRVYDYSLDHPLTHWPAHGDRLRQSLEQFGWPAPDWKALEQAAQQLAQIYPVLRITLFPQGKAWILGRALPPNLANDQAQGIIAWVADLPHHQRPLAGHKTGNYLGAWLARQDAQRQGATEAILTDVQGRWLETSTGNLWGWRKEQFWTPATEGQMLAGIARGQLLHWLTQAGESVHTEPWTLDLVKFFDGLAYSNSVVEVVPIRQVWNSDESLDFPLNSPKFQQFRHYFDRIH